MPRGRPKKITEEPKINIPIKRGRGKPKKEESPVIEKIKENKKETIKVPKNIKIDGTFENCCMWSNCEKYCKSDRKYLCCAFCPLTKCEIRCLDYGKYEKTCEYISNADHHKIEPYKEYTTLVKEPKKKE